MGLYLNSPIETESLYEAPPHKIKLNNRFPLTLRILKKDKESSVHFDDILRLETEILWN